MAEKKISATVSTIRTAPYSVGELGELPFFKVTQIQDNGYQKALSEEIIKEIDAANFEALRGNVLDLYANSHPIPLIIRTSPPLLDEFIVGKRYGKEVPDRIKELILYDVKDTVESNRGDRVSSEVVREQISRVRQSLVGGRELTLQEKNIASIFEHQIAEQSTNPYPEFNRQLSEIGAILFSASPLAKDPSRVNELVKGSPPIPLKYSRVELQNKGPIYMARKERVTILCRIIGKDSAKIDAFSTYFRELHNITPPFYVANNSPVRMNYERVVARGRTDEEASP